MRIKLFHTGVSLFQWEYRVQRSLIPLKMDEDSILTMKYQKEIVISFSPHFIFHCKKVTKKRIFSNYLYLCLTYKRYNKTQCCAPCPFHAAPVEPGSPDQSIRPPPPPTSRAHPSHSTMPCASGSDGSSAATERLLTAGSCLCDKYCSAPPPPLPGRH